MKRKTILILGLKVVALTVVYLICFIIASGVTIAPLFANQPGSAEASAAGQRLPLVAFLNVLVLAYTILRSRWSGWRLTATVFFIVYGVYTFMGMIEAAVFPPVVAHMPPGMLGASFIMGLLFAAFFAPLAVLILGKWKRDPAADEANTRLIMPAHEWPWKLALIVVVYNVLYFTFGYYVAWRNPAVQAYYGGTDPGNLLAQIGNVLRDTPWLPFFQILRALLWTLIALPVIRMMKGRWWEAGLGVGLLFAVIMNSGHLLPSPIMPEAVRMAHLVETASSNFLFGWVIAWLLHRHHTSLRDLFDKSPGSRIQVSPLTEHVT